MLQGFDSSIPPAAATSKQLAVVRFHGRDPEIWEKKVATAAERFRYDYKKKELEEWIPGSALAAEARRPTSS